MKFVLDQIKGARIKLAEKRFIEADKQLSAIESYIEEDNSSQLEPLVRVQIAEIIDKEIEIQKKIEKHIEQVETGERLRQMRLISQSKRIALEEIKKELLSNLSA